jgi:hypothetical protein
MLEAVEQVQRPVVHFLLGVAALEAVDLDQKPAAEEMVVQIWAAAAEVSG